jgi:hypothetical protein
MIEETLRALIAGGEGAGDDTLEGGDRRDILIGGRGADTLKGNGGGKRISWRAKPSAPPNRVTPIWSTVFVEPRQLSGRYVSKLRAPGGHQHQAQAAGPARL